MISAAVVRRGIDKKEVEKTENFIRSIKEGWNILCKKKGVLILVAISSGITLFGGLLGQGVGRGAALVITFAGVLLVITAMAILFPKSVKDLERD